MSTQAEDLFVGLDGAETRLPGSWQRGVRRAQETAVAVLLVGLLLAWIAALGFAAYTFIIQ
jgi:hypothetical protein